MSDVCFSSSAALHRGLVRCCALWHTQNLDRMVQCDRLHLGMERELKTLDGQGEGGGFSTVPTHQLLGSANAETTPAGAPAAAADRTQRPDATCEGKNG